MSSSAGEIPLKTFMSSLEETTLPAAGTEDVMRRLASETMDADGISVSTPVTAIMVVSAFVFLTVFSVIAYVMRVRYRHQRASWHHVDEDGIQLQPFLRSA